MDVVNLARLVGCRHGALVAISDASLIALSEVWRPQGIPASAAFISLCVGRNTKDLGRVRRHLIYPYAPGRPVCTSPRYSELSILTLAESSSYFCCLCQIRS